MPLWLFAYSNVKAFAIRFGEMAKPPHSPMANADFTMNWQSGCIEITMKNTGSERRENLGQSVFAFAFGACGGFADFNAKANGNDASPSQLLCSVLILKKYFSF